MATEDTEIWGLFLAAKRCKRCKGILATDFTDFTDEKEAAGAYDTKARELFGQFAYLNFPEENK